MPRQAAVTIMGRRLITAGMLALLTLAGGGAEAAKPPESFADLAEKLTPAVVNITALRLSRAAEESERSEATPFDDFTHEFFSERHGGSRHGDSGDSGDNESGEDQAPPHPPRPQSLGSGFVIDPSGLIVTNNHVVEDADKITVTLQDDRSFEAELVGHDTITDVALLKVKPPHPLPSVAWGDSSKARVGDWILAIGDPFGLGGTVTAGILSARAREINAGPYDDFLQTDAAINRGNSGGPMFNMAGEVIGINTAIYSPSGGSIGIGFAIPANLARPIVEQLRKTGKVARGWLGVHIQVVTPEIAESLGLDKAAGALIADVDPGGPAAAAQLQPGDIITSFDGKPIDRSHTLASLVAGTENGKDVALTLWREGRETTAKIKVGLLDPRMLTAARDDAAPLAPLEIVSALGLSLAKITPELRRRYALGERSAGVVITGVAADAAAADRGVSPGDLLVKIGRDAVTTPEEVVQKVSAARQAQRKSVLLRLERKGAGRYVAVPVDDTLSR